MDEGFRWGSALGFGTALFLVGAVFYLGIGLVTPFALGSSLAGSQVIISRRADSILFSGEPSEVLAEPRIANLHRIEVLMIAGGLVILGICQIAVTWFGLRDGNWWAWWTLVIGELAVLPYWFLATAPYRSAGISLRISDLPPYWWLPAMLLVPAAVLSAIGLLD